MLKKLSTAYEGISPGSRQVLSNIIWLFTDKLLYVVLSFLVGVWIARYLGPAQLGVYSYAVSIVALSTPFLQLGLDSLVIRDISKDPTSKSELLGTTFTLKLLSGIIIFLFILLITFVGRSQDSLTNTILRIIAIGTLFESFETISLWFTFQVQSKYIIVAKRTSYILVAAVRILLIISHAPLIAFAWAGILERVITAIGLVLTYQKQEQDIKLWRVSHVRAKTLLRESWPIVISGISIYVYAKIDQIMLGSLLYDKSELGFYSVAVRLSEFFDFLPGIVTSSIFPKLAASAGQNKNIYYEKMQIYFDLMFFLWIMVALPISFLSPLVISTFYGQDFSPAALILSLYVWAQFGTNFGIARSTFLIIQGDIKVTMYLTVIGAAFNILLNLFLISKMGALGATISTLITYFFVNILSNFISFQELKPVGKFILNSFNIYRSVPRLFSVFKSLD